MQHKKRSTEGSITRGSILQKEGIGPNLGNPESGTGGDQPMIQPILNFSPQPLYGTAIRSLRDTAIHITSRQETVPDALIHLMCIFCFAIFFPSPK